MPDSRLSDLLDATSPAPGNREEATEFQQVRERIERDPDAVARDLVKMRRKALQACQVAEAAEEMVQKLVNGNATLMHLESVRFTSDGRPRAVCRIGSQLRDLGVHPDVNADELARLQPWEYVCVNEDIVVSVWRDDPLLWSQAQGDIVEFKGYLDHDNFQVRVAHSGQGESTATLAGSLRLELLKPSMRLVLQRDDPRWAIAAVPSEQAESRFEVSLDQVHTRLDQLAGLESVAARFIEDVFLRVVFDDVKQQYDLTPLKGALLYSYKPGMGKTVFMRAFAVWLRDFGREAGFDLVLYHVKPNQLKSMWWGEDSRIVREDLFGGIRARQAMPRERPLVQLVVFDEIDSLQKRSGNQRTASSSSHSDALEALLVELEGLVQQPQGSGPAAHLLCVGMTNRPDRIDEALKRPGRFGDLVLEMPDIDAKAAMEIMAVYAAKSTLPWQVDGRIQQTVSQETIRTQFLSPAVAAVFDTVVARYATESQRLVDVHAGRVLAGVHYEAAMNRAKRRAALRQLQGLGVPGITQEDITDCLLEVAIDVARQMEADPAMLVNQLRIDVAVTRVLSIPKAELDQHRFLKVHSA